MPTYKIEWEIEIDESTPLLAAKESLDCIRNGDARCFNVTDLKTGKRFLLDLAAHDNDAVLERLP